MGSEQLNQSMGSEQSLQPNQSMGSEQCMQPNQSMESRQLNQSMESQQLNQSMGSEQLNQSMGSQQSLQPNQSMGSEQSLQPNQRMGSQQSMQPNQSMGSQQNMQPNQSMGRQQSMQFYEGYEGYPIYDTHPQGPNLTWGSSSAHGVRRPQPQYAQAQVSPHWAGGDTMNNGSIVGNALATVHSSSSCHNCCIIVRDLQNTVEKLQRDVTALTEAKVQ